MTTQVYVCVCVCEHLSMYLHQRLPIHRDTPAYIDLMLFFCALFVRLPVYLTCKNRCFNNGSRCLQTLAAARRRPATYTHAHVHASPQRLCIYKKTLQANYRYTYSSTCKFMRDYIQCVVS